MDKSMMEKYKNELMQLYNTAKAKDPDYKSRAAAAVIKAETKAEQAPVKNTQAENAMPDSSNKADMMDADRGNISSTNMENNKIIMPERVPQKKEEIIPDMSMNKSETEDDKISEIQVELPEGKGSMVVNVTYARRLYPLKGAKVTVFTGTADEMSIISDKVTDENGKAEFTELSAPNKNLAEHPESSITPYSLYNILVNAKGFESQIYLNIPIFDGVTSIQNADLALSNGDNSPKIISEAKSFQL